jgi:hypothetical protein
MTTIRRKPKMCSMLSMTATSKKTKLLKKMLVLGICGAGGLMKT